MKNYEKPIILTNTELSEGVYAASGNATDTTEDTPHYSNFKCNSIYMKGVWQAGDYSGWATDEHRAYKKQFGCRRCPADTDNGCGLLTGDISGQPSDGDFMPKWEKAGYGPDDPVTDWDVYM